VKSPRERGEFGNWLRVERKAQYANVAQAVAALQKRAGYGIAPSVWAELESGSRRPSQEQRERLESFFGTQPQAHELKDDENGRAVALMALTEAIREQTAVAKAQQELMREIVEQVREMREVQQGQAEGLAAVLGELAGTLERLRLAPAGSSRSNN
jgi:hypothetical protein